MKNVKIRNTVLLAAAAGACCAPAVLAQGLGGVVNISGATLLENYVRSEASTNDYIDVDGDGIAGWLGTTLTGGFPDQLALFGISGVDNPGTQEDQELVIQYRVTGSVNGFNELLFYGGPGFETGDSFDPMGILGAAPFIGAPNPGLATTAYNNRTVYISQPPNAGTRTGPYNAGNPGGAPNRANLTTLRATFGSGVDQPATGGIRIDIAPLDVSTFLAAKKPGTPKWNRPAAGQGYGANPRTSVNRQGGLAGANYPAVLSDVAAAGRNLFEPFTDQNGNYQYDIGEPFVDSNQNGVRDNPTANVTVFDTNLLYAPIALVVNPGTGIRQLKISEMRHLFGTGRAVTGENFMVITRDIGSGTRNAFQNCIGQDPSFGVGDNIGGLSTTSTTINLGADFVPNNKGSNGALESTLRNSRLGMGYIGTERGVTGSGSGSWLSTGALEIADVQNDIYGGTQYVRPTTNNLLHNGPNGWVIGGQAVLATIGDPRANGAASGGTGWPGAQDPFIDGSNGFPLDGIYQVGESFIDLNNNGVRDTSNAEAGVINPNPPMPNDFAARYMNNTSRSISAFTSVPNLPANQFMPGEFAATQFIGLAALDFLHVDADYTQLIPNPDFNLGVQNYINNPANNNVHFNPLFASFDMNRIGRNPTRVVLTSGSYSDGVALGSNYISQGGASLSYGGALLLRNRIAGDFNGDGLRNINDVTEMMRAARQRSGGPAWVAPSGTGLPQSMGGISGAPGSDACIEILGDFDGDGNFNALDVRTFADGLGIMVTDPRSGKVDRAAAFAAVDNAWLAITGGTNYFNTVLATPKPYAAGDSAGDVIGPSGRVARGFAPVGADGRVDALDIDYVYRQFKQNPDVTDGVANWTNLDEAVNFDLSADMDGDLDVDQDDITRLVTVYLGTTLGDVNLDGVTDCSDLQIIRGSIYSPPGTASWANGDLNGDGIVDGADIGAYYAAGGCVADVDDGSGTGTCDGGVTIEDLLHYLALFDSGDVAADVDDGSATGTPDGGVTIEDLLYFLARFDAGC